MLKTVVIPVEKIPAQGKYYTLGAFSSTDPGRLSIVDVQISWDGINAFGGYFKLCQRHSEDLNWTDVTTLNQSFATSTGSENLVIHDFSSGLVSVFINKASATTGTIKIKANAVKFAI